MCDIAGIWFVETQERERLGRNGAGGSGFLGRDEGAREGGDAGQGIIMD